MHRRLLEIENWQAIKKREMEAERAEYGDIKKYSVEEEYSGPTGIGDEFLSVKKFIQFLKDDERNSVSMDELQKLSIGTQKGMQKLRAELQMAGFPVEKKEINTTPPPRGFKSVSFRYAEFR